MTIFAIEYRLMTDRIVCAFLLPLRMEDILGKDPG
jgi:hypothetical protein